MCQKVRKNRAFFVFLGAKTAFHRPFLCFAKKVGSPHTMRNEVFSSSRGVAELVLILPEAPSALVCSRLVVLLVLGTSASLEEAWIG
jgi:hypothetical protein